ncbi:hypothetical protein FSP39_001843 [Pinctada imbricata]|uniref:DUF4326 domain-containing protein n=1 Tax=Pinctada imbricata TaxID=66713 RepID=A0AA88Y7N7_PINIB|nr:hypothetical protein FSP39_001843 [Pinctada imbricata]
MEILNIRDALLSNGITLEQWTSDENNIYMGSIAGNKWSNPYTCHPRMGAKEFQKCMRLYEQHIRDNLWNNLHELKGKTLGCWCYPYPCHADILKRLYEEMMSKRLEEDEKAARWLERKKVSFSDDVQVIDDEEMSQVFDEKMDERTQEDKMAADRLVEIMEEEDRKKEGKKRMFGSSFGQYKIKKGYGGCVCLVRKRPSVAKKELSISKEPPMALKTDYDFDMNEFLHPKKKKKIKKD